MTMRDIVCSSAAQPGVKVSWLYAQGMTVSSGLCSQSATPRCQARVNSRLLRRLIFMIRRTDGTSPTVRGAAAIDAGCAVFLGNEESGFAVHRPDRPRKVP